MSQNTPLAQRIRTLRIIHASFGAAIFVYTLVVAFNYDGSGASDTVVALRPALTLAAVMFAGASIWWRRRAARAMQGASAEALVDGSSFERLRTNCIISWAFSQSVAVMGVVMGLLSHQINEFVPFGLAALVLLLAHRPSVWPHWPIVLRVEAERERLQAPPPSGLSSQYAVEKDGYSTRAENDPRDLDAGAEAS